jgi:hypothetical protein
MLMIQVEMAVSCKTSNKKLMLGLCDRRHEKSLVLSKKCCKSIIVIIKHIVLNEAVTVVSV